MGLFGSHKSISGPPRKHVMFDHDHYYFHHYLSFILFVLILLSGLALTACDGWTGHNFWYTSIMWVSGTQDDPGTYQQWMHIISGILAGALILHFWILLFRMGRHYSDRQSARSHESHGIERTAVSVGGDYMFFLFQQCQNTIPFLTIIIGIGTTAFGLIDLWRTPFVANLSMDGGVRTAVGYLMAFIIAVIVFYLGPTFVVTGFHMLNDAQKEQRQHIAVIEMGNAQRSQYMTKQGAQVPLVIAPKVGTGSGASPSLPKNAASRMSPVPPKQASRFPDVKPMEDIPMKQTVRMNQESE